MTSSNHFIKTRISADVASGRTPRVVLRFPPEPNGYLHLGHVKSIVLNASLAEDFDAELNLRFDDTNPRKESAEYVEAIKHDAFWLTPGFTRVVWTSSYFDDIYRCAERLIRKGLAYVDDSSPDEMKVLRGDFGRPGINSPFRERSVEENLELFEGMRSGAFREGEKVLRARIDMSHANLNMRDPALYRISFAEHHATGTRWCCYPMYDFAHPIADALEGVTHSLCTLEFEDHRPLYDWVIENCHDLLGARPVQIEFARLEAEGVVLSKRKLNALVSEGHVAGWDSPEMPTVSGLRARGFTASMLKEFVTRCGFSRSNSTVSLDALNDCVVDALGPTADRRLAVTDPVELVLSGMDEPLPVTMANHPKDPGRGARPFSLTNSVWVERDDVRAVPEDGFWRLAPGNWVRLKNALNVLVSHVETSADGHVLRVHADVDPASVDMKAAKHKAKAVIHWLCDADSELRELRSYGALFDEYGSPSSEAVRVARIRVEKGLSPSTHYECERVGYVWNDSEANLHFLAKLKGPKAR